MIHKNIISKCESYSLGKKSKRKFGREQRASIKLVRNAVPRLHLVLKPRNEVRPIVRYKSGSMKTFEKYKIKERLAFLKTLHGERKDKLESLFSVLHSNWLRREQPKLYFVKADLSNAFGSVKRNLLLSIITKKMAGFQNSDQPLQLKNKFAVHYKELRKELQKPLLVRVGSAIYEWKLGLVQGYVYSPALSEVYYSHFDKLYFSHHLRTSADELKLFVRVVDDYLYITDSVLDAYSFLKALSRYENVNYSKTAANFQYEGIQFTEDVNFLGYTYNTKTLLVNRASNIYTGPICYKIQFTSSIKDINTFLKRRIGRTGVVINPLLFNFRSGEEIVWRQIFMTLCISANKFCTILSILCNESEMLNYLSLYKQQVAVKLCNAMIDVLLRDKLKDSLFKYCINHFRYLSWKALWLCARKTPKCNNLVPYIESEVSKSNCIFGKWREHASQINSSGECQTKATRIICARPDLRSVMKTFEELPAGFECYKNIFL
ncbi:unnamed protein product [Leptosia nina]|uniref:Telomerase reverse transcriptase n=1 Tax=Leptosia nina TaxID=320188 RepID=A0AAV1IXD5_9NEOP